MPLQGLNDETKERVLRRLVDGKYSIKELQNTCASIKKKKKIQQAICKHVGGSSWESVVRRFPNHTTEEKLASFSDLAINNRGSSVPEVNVLQINPFCFIACMTFLKRLTSTIHLAA